MHEDIDWTKQYLAGREETRQSQARKPHATAPNTCMPDEGSKMFEQFIDHRVLDARKELMKNDPDYVRCIGELLRLHAEGVEVTESMLDEKEPGIRLSKGWHRLLEACFELPWKVWRVQYTARAVQRLERGLTAKDILIRSGFYRESTFIHLQVLCEEVKSVIDRTAILYLPSPLAKEVSSEYKRRANEELGGIIKLRNQYVHQPDFAARGITSTQRWEMAVSAKHNGFRVSDPDVEELADDVRRGGPAWDLISEMAEDRIRRLAQVLVHLEGKLGEVN